jgi:hypothetical protein
MFRQRHETEGPLKVVAVGQVATLMGKVLRVVLGWDL